ncbi:MAG: hypothetical protein FJ225_11975 [Lentisphaerae bacterium]|nr:hypothetical protein [Lentisphaerota bacterium]
MGRGLKPVRRRFLGWDRPVRESVGDCILPHPGPGPADLGDTLIVVPTRQAGRRLRETLALKCAEQRTVLLAARTVPPSFFFMPPPGGPPPATPAVVQAAWAQVLRAQAPGACPGLLPSRAGARDFAWAAGAGGLIQSLRERLAEGGYGVTDVPAACGEAFEERERWSDLARLEAAFLERLRALGFADPCALKRLAADEAPPPPGVKRIVLAAVPDPPPLALRALRRLASQVAVEALIPAPARLAHAFDAFGRPAPGVWNASPLDIPDPARNLLLAGTPAGQAREALAVMAAADPAWGPGDVAIGAPDRAVVPFLESMLTARGLPCFDPADKPLRNHSLYLLLESYGALVSAGSCAALGAFLRHPDVLRHLQARRGLKAESVLAELDAFNARHLPQRLADIAGRLGGRGAAPGAPAPFAALAAAVGYVEELRAAAAQAGVEPAARALLKSVYADRALRRGARADDEMRQAAAAADRVLREIASLPARALDLARGDVAELLFRRLRDERYAAEPSDAAVDLEGWLELPWNDAPLLIVTGMNEGAVPDGRLEDAFLPDSLLKRLGLRDDAQRAARDACLMRLLVETRRAAGRACFICGKTGARGEPLKPSRLLFRCRDADLPERARRMFARPADPRPAPAPRIGFRLRPAQPPDAPALRRGADRISVTAFRDYLACPFRYYLKHVLGMERVNARKSGMDALDFGTMVHDVLDAMGRRADLRACDDGDALFAFLGARLDAWIEERYGPAPALPVLMAADAARRRLREAARVQAGLAREGWEIVATESRRRMTIGGLTVHGRIDRMDRHRETGRMRVIDYKTADTAGAPREAHLGRARPDTPAYAAVAAGGAPLRWLDLQLPLYMLLAGPDLRDAPGAEPAYFSLPKAMTHTGLTAWTDLTPELLAAAERCAASVAGLIREGAFETAAAAVAHDDFEDLFIAEPEECFDLEEMRLSRARAEEENDKAGC